MANGEYSKDERNEDHGRENRKHEHADEGVVRIHESQISDLYDKYNSMRDILEKFNIRTERLSIEMENGFSSVGKEIKSIGENVIKICKKQDEFYEKHNLEMDKINTKFTELDKFKWFRDRMNKWHDSSIFSACKFLIYLIAILAILHWSNVGEFLKKKIFGG